VARECKYWEGKGNNDDDVYINKQVCNYVGATAPEKHNPKERIAMALRDAALMDFIQSNDSFQNEIIILCLFGWSHSYYQYILNSQTISFSPLRAHSRVWCVRPAVAARAAQKTMGQYALNL
jgi:hypothetical protein